MMAHGHGCVHYALELYSSNCNHNVGSFAKILRDLEQPLVSLSREFFYGAERSPLYHVVLYGSDICLQGL